MENLMYEIKIYDFHYKIENIDNEVRYIPTDLELKKFDYSFDVSKIEIVDFRSYAFVDKDDNVTLCTKVFLSDEAVIYAVNQYDTFKKNYNENYLPILEKCIDQK